MPYNLSALTRPRFASNSARTARACRRIIGHRVSHARTWFGSLLQVSGIQYRLPGHTTARGCQSSPGTSSGRACTAASRVFCDQEHTTSFTAFCHTGSFWRRCRDGEQAAVVLLCAMKLCVDSASGCVTFDDLLCCNFTYCQVAWDHL